MLASFRVLGSCIQGTVSRETDSQSAAKQSIRSPSFSPSCAYTYILPQWTLPRRFYQKHLCSHLWAWHGFRRNCRCSQSPCRPFGFPFGRDSHPDPSQSHCAKSSMSHLFCSLLDYPHITCLNWSMRALMSLTWNWGYLRCSVKAFTTMFFVCIEKERKREKKEGKRVKPGFVSLYTHKLQQQWLDEWCRSVAQTWRTKYIWLLHGCYP